MDSAVYRKLPTTPRAVNRGLGHRNQSVPAAQVTMPSAPRPHAGDVEAFNQLVLSTQALAYRIAYRLLHNGELAADAVQDSLIKAFRALATYRGGNFKSWFLRILINTCYDQLRRQKQQPTTGLDDLTVGSDNAIQLRDPTEPPEAFAERMELRHWIERGLVALPMEQRLVLVLCDVEGYAYEEICELTGAPMGTVKSRLSRGRIRLRDFLLKHKVLATEIG